jgi:hypothetical protein
MKKHNRYVDVLKLFLATLKAAYDQGIPIPELVESVAEMDESRKSANRELTSEELSLRTLWMNLSYLTMEYLYRIEDQTDNLEFDSNIDQALQESLGVSMTTRAVYKSIVEEKVNQFLGQAEERTDYSDLLQGDTAQKAMMMYSLKIIDIVLIVIKEERAANDSGGLDGNGIGPPRPNIPMPDNVQVPSIKDQHPTPAAPIVKEEQITLSQSTSGATEEEGLTQEKISVLLELTFIEACLQLATG